MLGCDIEVRNAAPDSISFTVRRPTPGVPIDTTYALASRGVVEGIVAGMPRSLGLTPMPGDAVVTLSLLQTVVSINVGSGLNAKFTPLQLLVAYVSFIHAMFDPSVESGASVQAAVHAFVAFVEICRLDSGRNELVPPHLRKVKSICLLFASLLFFQVS